MEKAVFEPSKKKRKEPSKGGDLVIVESFNARKGGLYLGESVWAVGNIIIDAELYHFHFSASGVHVQSPHQ